MSVLPNGYTIGCTKRYPASVSDLTIFHKNAIWHEEETKKTEGEITEYIDIGELSAKVPNEWAILANKGYQGSTEFLRVMHPKKKPKNGELTKTEEHRNKLISSDRIFIEN